MSVRTFAVVAVTIISLMIGWTKSVAQESAPAAAAETPTESPADPSAAAPAKKQPASAEKTAATEQELDRLPAPLDTISGDFSDIEATGFVVVKSVAMQTTADGDEALVWTLRVVRPLTCQHALTLLHGFRDVRFYAVDAKYRREIVAAAMWVSNRLTFGAERRDLLRVDEEFEVYVVLGSQDLRRLRSLKANTVQFRTRR